MKRFQKSRGNLAEKRREGEQEVPTKEASSKGAPVKKKKRVN